MQFPHYAIFQSGMIVTILKVKQLYHFLFFFFFIFLVPVLKKGRLKKGNTGLSERKTDDILKDLYCPGKQIADITKVKRTEQHEGA